MAGTWFKCFNYSSLILFFFKDNINKGRRHFLMKKTAKGMNMEDHQMQRECTQEEEKH